MLRQKLLKLLLGKNLTIFIDDIGQNYYRVEVADSKKRIKLLTFTLQKLTAIRYRLVNYQSF